MNQNTNSSTNTKVERAIISVSDKTGLLELAQGLSDLGIEILASGGTYNKIIEAGIKAVEVSDYTGFPEMMQGRLKTLHPKIHGGILGRRGLDEAVMQEHQIQNIDLVVVNLYPFKQTLADPSSTPEKIIENIDIGGPTLIRSAAKNHKSVAVVVDPSDYGELLQILQKNQGLSFEQKQAYAGKAFAHTADYDKNIAAYFAGVLGDSTKNTNAENSENSEKAMALSANIDLDLVLKNQLRYGENPHQKAGFFVDTNKAESGMAGVKVLQGKEMSFNNLADADAALRIAYGFEKTACSIIKHANPCGVAVAEDQLTAYQKALATDPVSAFGGIIAFNKKLSGEVAEQISKMFVEVILAPGFDDKALEIFSKKQNLRLCDTSNYKLPRNELYIKSISGGFLVQDEDLSAIDNSEWKVVTKRQPTPQELEDMRLAWQVVRQVKSNAIVYAKDGGILGVGAGQMSRVFAAQIGVEKAGDAKLDLHNSAMASDAFFPFADGLEVGIQAGISCAIQPGGSVRDAEVIEAADKAGISMIFTGKRHFLH